MKRKFSFLFLLFAFATLSASAQTGEKQEQQAAKVWMPEKTPPVAEFFPGGQEAMYQAVYKELTYPALAKRNRVQGETIVSFTINPDGSTTNFKVLRNAGAGTGDEALRVAKLLKFKAPGFAVDGSIPIMFKL